MRRPVLDFPHVDKFTDRARKVLSYSQEEARRFNHHYVGTEHLLLGLLRVTDDVAARVLANLDVDLNKARSAVEFVIGRGDRLILEDPGRTLRANTVLELALDEARRLNHRYVGTEHILVGLVVEGEGIAAGVLSSLGVTPETVRTQMLRLMGSGAADPNAPRGNETSSVKSNVVTCRLDDAALSALDALVEAGVRTTRSDAAAWLIAAGIESHRALFARVNATVSEIRRLRMEARALAGQEPAEGQEPQSSPETPPNDDAPTDEEETPE